MADRFINWPPPVEALKPLARALARVQFERAYQAAIAARRALTDPNEEAAGALSAESGSAPSRSEPTET